ncbi:MAG: glycerate kinase [Hydrogenophaga sp.]|uniref:glycerate kinase n=1 Tax=Hydrogenophaga sp. TaxID=1904254 RepID=UPI002AB9232B|nr:glycerate kinase [Hydrogenophaga sp.]MDZ4188916.1 glycerate kinase [Hydrogenophaga sp.]
MPQIPHRLRALIFPALAAAIAYAAWRSYGAQGLLLAVLMIVFWVLLHFTKLMRLLRTAAERPLGHVQDAAGLHSQLKRGQAMTDVMRRTLSLGLRRSDEGQEPEVFEWQDEQGHRVICAFRHGRLESFVLHRADPENPPSGT